MPEYSFGEKEEQTEKSTPSSRSIQVEDGTVTFKIDHHPATAPAEIHHQTAQASNTAQPSNAAATNHPQSKPVRDPVKKNPMTIVKGSSGVGIINRIWHVMEFVSVTAVVFSILFLIINFDSYSRLFMSKLDQLRGQVNSNPYTQQELAAIKTASSEGQTPLPIVNNPQATKKQVPELNLAVAPPDDRVIIPRIGQNVPIVRVPTDRLIQRDWSALEKQIQDALRYGVVHFPGTAFPGDNGNVVLTGHSSYFPWDSGRFKDVFALLHQVDVGDEVIVYHDQTKYRYIVSEKKVVKPSQVDVLTQEGGDRLTLITCTPVGTDLNRLIILAKPE